MKTFTLILNTGQSFDIKADRVIIKNGDNSKSRYTFQNEDMEPVAEFAIDSVAGWAEKEFCHKSKIDLRK